MKEYRILKDHEHLNGLPCVGGVGFNVRIEHLEGDDGLPKLIGLKVHYCSCNPDRYFYFNCFHEFFKNFDEYFEPVKKERKYSEFELAQMVSPEVCEILSDSLFVDLRKNIDEGGER